MARRPAVWLTALVLIAPWGALASGVQSEDIENRYRTPFPSVRAGWGFFADLDTYLVERLPLRKQAVAADAWVDVHVFRTAPTAGQVASSKIVVGDEGWLYLAGELERQCSPPSDPAAAIDNVERLTSAIERSGRRVVFAVAPDKSTVVPEHLPDGYRGSSCYAEGRRSLWKRLRASDIVGFVDLRAALEEEERSGGVPVYLRKDTHWTDLGAMLLARESARVVDPRVAETITIRRRAARDYTGDLSSLSGLPEVDRAPTYDFVRGSGVHVDVSDRKLGELSRSRSAAPLVDGRTLYLFDSFGEISLPSIRRAYAEVESVRLVDLTASHLVRAIERSDTVVIEVAQRELTWHFGGRLDWDALNATIERRLGVPTMGAEGETMGE